jgi:hypothetical protein
MSRWVRWYEGTVEDAKFRVVARMSRVTVRDVVALWAFILEDAGHLDHRGVCKRNEKFMTATLDFKEGVVDRILKSMEETDLVSIGNDGVTVCNFKRRQFDSDVDRTATRRKREQRERDNETSHEHVTRDTGGSESETYTEEEKKESRRVARATAPNSDFDEFWKAYPKRKGENPKAPARKLFDAAVKQGADPKAIIAGVKAACARNRDKIGTEFIPQAVKWLRDRRWEDYAQAAEAAAHPDAPIDWDQILATFKQFGRWPSSGYGGQPGMVSCRVPAETLRKHGYDPPSAVAVA